MNVIVGLLSSYREGPLAAGALRSLAAAGCDRIYLYEGPAGEPLEGDMPDTDYGPLPPNTVTHVGRWRSDARKRQAMLEHAKRDYPNMPLWGLTVDADEVLVNGEYVRDIVNAIMWNDEQADTPTIRFPFRLVEADGSVALTGNRLVRLDLIRQYEIGSSAVVNAQGIREGHGNLVAQANVPLSLIMAAIDRGREACWPPFPCEPHIFHRSYLRHPARRGHRLHRQEADELARLGVKT